MSAPRRHRRTVTEEVRERLEDFPSRQRERDRLRDLKNRRYYPQARRVRVRMGGGWK